MAKKNSEKNRLENQLFEEFQRYGLPLPDRQVYFHPTRKFRFDFAWPKWKIALEVQGGLYMRSSTGHTSRRDIEDDFFKHNEATRFGWQLYRFGPKALYIPKTRALCSEALAYMNVILKKAMQ